MKTPPAECPICGAAVPRNARACPACGADERSGWDEEATRYDGLDLPNESVPESPRRSLGAAWKIAVAVLVALALAYLLLR